MSRNHCSRLDELHECVTDEIIEAREAELKERREQQRAEEQFEEDDDRESLRIGGINVDELQTFEADYVEQAEQEIEEIEARLDEASRDQLRETLEVGDTFLPEGAVTLRPVWLGEFSDDDDGRELVATSALTTGNVLSGGACKDYYNWAKGGGWGCTGGVGDIQSWVEFGFWFKPSANRYFSIIPHYRYRGYYIVKADDKWYNCKSARVTVTQWVDVWQHGHWKGWTNETVNNVGGGNINVNRRFDDDRHMYSSYLLGGGDWAFIRCVIGLRARAKGGGSYAKNDFSTGGANHLCVPHCHVF